MHNKIATISHDLPGKKLHSDASSATSWERLNASTSWSNICMDLGTIYSKRLNSDAIYV
jgi:hypothetical protein